MPAANSRLPQWGLTWLINCSAFINICSWLTVKCSEIRQCGKPQTVSGRCKTTTTTTKNGNKKEIKACKNGHQFFKSSDCPTCPICGEERKPKDNFLSNIGAPAIRALEREGITTLELLSTCSEKEILALHGMGKSTIPKLNDLLKNSGLFFKK